MLQCENNDNVWRISFYAAQIQTRSLRHRTVHPLIQLVDKWSESGEVLQYFQVMRIGIIGYCRQFGFVDVVRIYSYHVQFI